MTVVDQLPTGLTMDHTTDPGTSLCAEWDSFVEAIPGTDVTQLTSWARIRAHQGFSAAYVVVQREGCLVGGAQILVRRVPGLGPIAYLPYGPVVSAATGARADVVDALGTGLGEFGRRTRMLFVQPPEAAEDVSNDLLRRGFRPSRAAVAPRGSCRVDLRADEDAIRARLSRRLRSRTGHWTARGVTVRRGDERDLRFLADAMVRSAAEHNFRPPRYEYLCAIYTGLAARGNVALFIGEVHGVPTSADLVTMCGDMVRGRLGGFDRSGEGGRLGVPAAVRWHIIRWAKESGYRWLDFGGLSERALRGAVDEGLRDSPDWSNSDRTKMAFGATAFRYPTPVEFFTPRVVRVAYDAAVRSARGRLLVERAKSTLRVGPVPVPERQRS